MPCKIRRPRVLGPTFAVLALVVLAPLAAAGEAASGEAFAQAVARQRALVRAWPAGVRIAGYKSAFTAPEIQRRFGVDRPALAVLTDAGERCAGASACTIRLADYRRLVLEIEVALRLGEAITRPLASEEELLARLDGVMAAVELPELALEGVEAPTGLDYVATNIGVRGYVLGPPREAVLLRRGALPMSLARGELVLARGDGGGALQSALALVNAVLAAGYELRAGQVLLTGAVGGMVPGEAGDYVADFGELGRLELRVR